MQSAAQILHNQRTALFGKPDTTIYARARHQGRGGGRTPHPPLATHISAGARAAEANRAHSTSTTSLFRLDRNPPQQQISSHHTYSEMIKSPSTDFIDNLAWTIHHKKWESVTIRDFDSRDTSDEKSLLLTMVINQALSRDPGLSDTQLARVAAHAAIRHPEYLFQLLADIGKATQFITTALATRPPQLREHMVCPMDTPYLIDEPTLRGQLGLVYLASP